jgi:dynein heavy chain
VTAFDKNTDAGAYEEVAKQARALKDKLDAANAQAKRYNNQELLTNEEETNYDNIKQMLNDFTPFYELWTTTDLWKLQMSTWMADDFEKIDPAQMEEQVDNSVKTLGKIQKVFRNKDLTKILKICETMKEQVNEFAPKVPMIMAMRVDGIKDRHWEAISKKVGMEVKPYEGFSLEKVFEMDLMKFSDDIVDIGDRAGKEYQIEVNLEKMKREWLDIIFGMKPYKDSGTCTVTGFDDAWNIVDEHSVLTQTMQFSSFKGPFVEEIEEWNEQLLFVSNCLEEWQKCMANWSYLQPIFDSNDIQKQLPGESRKFKNVDKIWREIIKGTRDDSAVQCNVLKACNRPVKEIDLLTTFKKCNDELDKV